MLGKAGLAFTAVHVLWDIKGGNKGVPLWTLGSQVAQKDASVHIKLSLTPLALVLARLDQKGPCLSRTSHCGLLPAR